MSSGRYRVFLSYNSQDRKRVKEIARQLQSQGIKPWLNDWALRPGLPYQQVVGRQIQKIPSAAVFVGPNGLGPWQSLEAYGLLHQFVLRGCPVIPVLLPDCPEVPDLPLFLTGMSWVDFRQSDPEPMAQLRWGITGEAPKTEPPEPRFTDEASRRLAVDLDTAFQEAATQTLSGRDTTAIQEAILNTQRRLRESGLQAGDFLGNGRFRLIGMVGRGGFATVWEAYDQIERRGVAVKVLHLQYAKDNSRRNRFFRGARKMAELRHPNIVHVVEKQLVDDAYPFFVMEFISGGDLRQAVVEGDLETEVALPLLVRAGEALAYAHRQGAVHRDVKPANILLDRRRQPKLTDFDLGWANDTTSTYAAPEALAGDVSPRLDIYSFAMTVAFVLHGADLPPTVLRGTRPFLKNLSCGQATRAALLRATELIPSDRFRSMEELLAALDTPPAGPPAAPANRMASTQIKAAEHQPAESPDAAARRQTILKILLVVMLAGTALALIYLGLLWSRSQSNLMPEDPIVQRETELLAKADRRAADGDLKGALSDLKNACMAKICTRNVQLKYISLATRLDREDILKLVLLAQPDIEIIEHHLPPPRPESEAEAVVPPESEAEAVVVVEPPPPAVARTGELQIIFRTWVAKGSVTVKLGGVAIFQESFAFTNTKTFKKRFLKGEDGIDQTLALDVRTTQLVVETVIQLKDGPVTSRGEGRIQVREDHHHTLYILIDDNAEIVIRLYSE